MSPDGEAIVTGAGDETLRFWNVFSKMRSTKVLILSISHLYLRLRSLSLLRSVCNIRLSVCNCLHLTSFCLPPCFRNRCQCWTSSPGSGSKHASVLRGNKAGKGNYLCMYRAVNGPLLWVFTSVVYRGPPQLPLVIKPSCSWRWEGAGELHSLGVEGRGDT